jgi:hypothetical protein
MSDEKILSAIIGDSWISCLACGQRVTGDSKHTCLPKLRELTNEEIYECHDKTNTNNWVIDFARAILKKASEK